MAVESKYTIAIAALCDWLEKLAAVFQPMRNETKQSALCVDDISRALSRMDHLQARAGCSKHG